MIETRVQAFRKRNVLYGVQKSKVVDHKKVCNLIFLHSDKSSGMTGKNGESSGRCARHNQIRDVQYRQIQGQHSQKDWIRQDLGRAPVTKAQIDTLLSYGATWWVRDDLERERAIRYHNADQAIRRRWHMTGRYTSTATVGATYKQWVEPVIR